MSGATTVLVLVAALGAACTGGALATLVPDAPGTAEALRTYVREWTAAGPMSAAALVNAVRVA